MIEPCVGFLELQTIAKGIEVADALLKKAPVEIVFAHTVSSGKYLIMFHGQVEAVRSSLDIGREVGGKAVIDFFLLPNIDPTILPALDKDPEIAQLSALGILEVKTCGTCIKALDIALKTAEVKLIKLHLAKGIAGKAYFIIDGEVSDVESAMLAGLAIANQHNHTIENIIIPQATSDLLTIFTQ